MNNILGIPFNIWGFICLGISVLYFFMRPKPRNDYESFFFPFVLRWFHPLVWLILATSSFLHNSLVLSKKNVPMAVAGVALLFYLIFIVVYLRDQRGDKKVRDKKLKASK